MRNLSRYHLLNRRRVAICNLGPGFPPGRATVESDIEWIGVRGICFEFLATAQVEGEAWKLLDPTKAVWTGPQAGSLLVTFSPPAP